MKPSNMSYSEYYALSGKLSNADIEGLLLECYNHKSELELLSDQLYYLRIDNMRNNKVKTLIENIKLMEVNTDNYLKGVI